MFSRHGQVCQMDSWVHCQRSARKFGAKCWQWTGLGFRHRILCPGICHPADLPCTCSDHSSANVGGIGRWVVGTGAGPTPCAGPHQHPWAPRVVTVHPSKRRRRCFGCSSRTPVYGILVITQTVRYAGRDWGNQKWVWKKAWIKRGPGNFFSMPNTTRPLIKFQSFRMATAIGVVRECSLGFQWNDNMFLDVSGQVRKLHGCIADNFHPMSRAPGIGMPLPCGHFVCLCASLVLRCGIGSEMSTPNFKTTLHKVFGSCFRNKWACSLAVGLFLIVGSTCVDPRYVMLWRVVETCATQPPQFAEKRETRVCSRDGGGPYSGVATRKLKSMCEKCKIDLLRLFGDLEL